MTRKHVTELAKQLRAMRPMDPVMVSGWRGGVIACAAACRQFNPAFSVTRFYAACGME